MCFWVESALKFSVCSKRERQTVYRCACMAKSGQELTIILRTDNWGLYGRDSSVRNLSDNIPGQELTIVLRTIPAQSVNGLLPKQRRKQDTHQTTEDCIEGTLPWGWERRKSRCRSTALYLGCLGQCLGKNKRNKNNKKWGNYKDRELQTILGQLRWTCEKAEGNQIWRIWFRNATNKNRLWPEYPATWENLRNAASDLALRNG